MKKRPILLQGARLQEGDQEVALCNNELETGEKSLINPAISAVNSPLMSLVTTPVKCLSCRLSCSLPGMQSLASFGFSGPAHSSSPSSAPLSTAKSSQSDVTPSVHPSTYPATLHLPIYPFLHSFIHSFFRGFHSLIHSTVMGGLLYSGHRAG